MKLVINIYFYIAGTDNISQRYISGIYFSSAEKLTHISKYISVPLKNQILKIYFGFAEKIIFKIYFGFAENRKSQDLSLRYIFSSAEK